MTTLNAKIKAVAENTNYPGFEKLFKAVQQQHPDITRDQVKKYVARNYTYQVTKETKKPAPHGHVVAFDVGEQWQMDVLYYQC